MADGGTGARTGPPVRLPVPHGFGERIGRPGRRSAALAVWTLAALGLLYATHRSLAASEQRFIEREAVKVAEVVAQHAIATHAAFDAAISEGAAIPTGILSADAFIDSIGTQAQPGDAYAYRWLPRPASGEPLDRFQRWAWDELQRQAGTQSAPAARWESVWRLGTFDGRRLLRYVRPVPLRSPDCVECPAVTRFEQALGGSAGARVFEPALPLQGALEVLVPIEQVEAFAAVQTRGTQNLVIAAGLVGFTLVTFLAVRAARHQRRIARRYERLAKVDTLTGLANRLDIEHRMHDILSAAAGSSRGLGVLFIDVDDFKNINDSLGHAAGDEVLKVLAGRLRAALRDGDVLARYSGDEFVAVAADAPDAGSLATVAGKLIRAVTPVIRVRGNDIFVTVSIGIAHHPTDGIDAATLLKHADAAMYRAKEKGRNGFQFFAAEMNAAALEKLQMSSNLWHALNRSEFVVHYQPQADARTGHVVGFEALVRWNHPEHGVLPPGRFITHAENSGAIEPLGEWVLDASLAQLRAWSGVFDGSMAVNLSMRQLYNPELPAIVRRALARHAIAPSRLELEVTESMVGLNPEAATRMLSELCRLGVCIALDDFGTGQSSLSHLLRFPIGTLKVDRSFTADIPACADACSIVRAIIALARSLRMRVIAEGVETPQQQRFFESEGCDEIQGYLVGMPMTADEAAGFLQSARRRARRPQAARMGRPTPA